MDMLCTVKKWAWILALAVLASCGGGGGGGGGSSSATTAPVISAQTTQVSVYETQKASLTVTATGSGSLTYQWKKNGAAIAGATGSTYTIASAALADSGSYSVEITANGSTTTSATIPLSVQLATPVIVTAPTPQSVMATDTATFSVTANGLPPMKYQWYRINGTGTGAGASVGAGATLPAGAAEIVGETNASYTLKNVKASDNNAQFFAKVTNAVGVEIVSDPSTLKVLPLAFSDLIVSEVSSCHSGTAEKVDCWFEIYNPTASAVNVSAYTVRTNAYGVTGPQVFTLPNVSIAPLSYAIISGNIDGRAQINSQNIRMGSTSVRPSWGASGFVELLKNAATVDFVSFGSSAETPITAKEWSGSPAAALPSSAIDYGKSIVRPHPIAVSAVAGSASDWISVNFATPAGRNDVPAGAKDEDGDGIPDSAEVSGGTFAGLDLYAMGARSGKKDIFIEVDHMNSADPGIVPQKAALQKVVDAFAARNIGLHFDAGTDFSATFDTANFNLGQTTSTVAYERCVEFDQTTCYLNTSSRRSVYDWKDEYMDLRRRAIFHYALFGNSQVPNGAGNGSSGQAEIIGNDFIVTLGSYGLNASLTSVQNRYTNYQAATIMHELGHNLGLRHGGFEDANYKPNYWSVMNYLYDLNGLDPNAKSATAWQRWRYYLGDRTVNGYYFNACGLPGAACGSPDQFVIDFSDGSGMDLDENALLESNNVGRGANAGAYADWNMDGSLASFTYSKDLNNSSTRSVLKDHNDWSNLVLPFARYSSNYNSGASVNSKMVTTSTPSVLDPITSDRQAVIKEPPRPAWFFEELRSIR